MITISRGRSKGPCVLSQYLHGLTSHTARLIKVTEVILHLAGEQESASVIMFQVEYN